jgi:hypothetical protein
MAGVALGDIDVPFVWQVWRLVTLTLLLRGGGLGRVWRRVTLSGSYLLGLQLQLFVHVV